MSAPALPAERITKGSRQFFYTSAALFIGAFSTFALLYCMQPLMPVLSHDFKISAAQSSLAISVSTITLAVGLLLTGPISDRFGRKPIMVISLLCAGLLTLASALMPTWESVLVMRALLGLALSGLAAVAMTYLYEEMDPSCLGLAIGLYIAGTALGGMAGRVICGVLVDFIPWRWAIGSLGLLSLSGALVFCKVLPASRNFNSAPLNLRRIGQAFVLHLGDRGLPWIFLEAFLLMGAFVTLYNYIGYRLLDAPYHLSQAFIGLISLAYLVGIYSSAWGGSLADRLGRRKVLWAFISLMLSGLLLTLCQPLPMILLGILLFTFGFFAAHSAASSWVGRRALSAKGQASSMYLFAYYLGSSVAGTAGGLFWQAYGWPGVGLFISSLLVVAILVSIYLSHLPAKEAP